VKLSKVEHIAIVVKDIDQAMRLYQSVLGLELEGIEVYEEYQARLALLRLGDCLIELIQDLGSDGEYANFIKERGEGLHHICFEVDDIEEALRELEKTGIPLFDHKARQGHQGSKIAFLNPSGANGVLLELCEKPK